MTLPPVIYVLIQTGAQANGGISSIGQIITGLQRHRAIVVTDRETDRFNDWGQRGIETHVIPQTVSRGLLRDPINGIRSYVSYTRELGRIIASIGAKIVHANDPAAFQLALPAAKLSRGVKIALNIRDTIDPARRPPRTRYRALFSAADHVFYLSNDMADRWLEVAPNAKSACSVTYSAVDPAIFRPATVYEREGPPVVLLSGLICAKKGQLEFLREISPRLAAEGIETWISGDFNPARDAYAAACAEAAAPLGEMVQFLGYRDDIAELMARAAVIAVPSRHEGLVRAMIEAMGCSRPVVSFDVCSAREILEEKSGGAGIVVKHGDYEGMAEAIIRYCTDRELAADAGARGQATAAALFAPEQVVNRYERVYERLAAE